MIAWCELVRGKPESLRLQSSQAGTPITASQDQLKGLFKEFLDKAADFSDARARF